MDIATIFGKEDKTMRDWNHDGNEDYWDDIYYMENIESYYHNDEAKINDEDDDDIDELVDGLLTGANYSSGGQRYSSYTPTQTSTGVPFIVRLIIAITIISIVGAFSELLGFVLLIIWAYIEIVG